MQHKKIMLSTSIFYKINTTLENIEKHLNEITKLNDGTLAGRSLVRQKPFSNLTRPLSLLGFNRNLARCKIYFRGTKTCGD